jgi:hypothetical protein
VDGRDEPGHDASGGRCHVTSFIHQGRPKAGAEFAMTEGDDEALVSVSNDMQAIADLPA